MRFFTDMDSRWIDSTYDDNYRPTLMLQNRELLEALKQSSTIKGVSILFASQYLDDPEDAFNCSIPLAGFKNLTSLELYNFYGNLDTLVEDIADALGECPCLKTLGLGWGCAYDCEDLPEALLIDEELTFLQKLCLDYGSRSQSSPLALDTLRLGQGMFLYDSVLPHSPQTAKYLCKLVQVDALKRLHVWNGLVKWDIDDEHESMEVDWYQLDGCKSLRQLSVSRLEEDLLDWLNTGANSVQELIITDHYGMYDDDLDNFRFLSLQNLSMLFIREMTVSKRNEDDFWSDTDSSVTDSSEAETTSGEESSSEPEARSRARTLSEAETSSQAGSISESEISSEAGTPYSELDRSIITVLDRLSDNGAQLTRLGLCIDLETQWVGSSTT
jgi:hypothetical protein